MSVEFFTPEKNTYTIYSKSGCPKCIKVKHFLHGVNVAPTIVDCDEYIIENREEFLKFIETHAGTAVKVFPMVFYDGEYIGGYEETEKHYNMLSAFSTDVYF